MAELKKLPSPVFLVEMTTLRMACEWFRAKYWTEETKLHIHTYSPTHPRNSEGDPIPGYNWKGWEIKGMVARDKNDQYYHRGKVETTVGSIRIYDGGEIVLRIPQEYGYLFDDTLAVYKKMEES